MGDVGDDGRAATPGGALGLALEALRRVGADAVPVQQLERKVHIFHYASIPDLRGQRSGSRALPLSVRSTRQPQRLQADSEREGGAHRTPDRGAPDQAQSLAELEQRLDAGAVRTQAIAQAAGAQLAGGDVDGMSARGLLGLYGAIRACW